MSAFPKMIQRYSMLNVFCWPMMLRPPIWGVIPNGSERNAKRPEWLSESNMFGTGTTTCYIEVTKKAALFPQRGPSGCERTQPVVRRHGSAAQRWDLVLPPVDPPTLTSLIRPAMDVSIVFPLKMVDLSIVLDVSVPALGYCWSYDYREKGFFSDSHADSWSWNGSDVSKRYGWYGWPNLVLDRAQSSRPQRK